MRAKASEICLLASDWDGTMVDTFTPSPRGRGVEAGYRYALSKMFGDTELLDKIGGLQNRASAEVIAAVLAIDDTLGTRGFEYSRSHAGELKDLVPRGKGIQSARPSVADILTETLVRVRLQFLMPEISSEWPKPFDGVLECLASLEASGIRVAIISSGHTSFIEKTFGVWGVPVPRFVVSDDDMRMLGLPTHKSCKPSRVLYDMLMMCVHQRSAGSRPEVRAYVGDCPIRDRGLAVNADLPFYWFNPKKRPAPSGFGVNELQFHSWRDVHTLLR